MMRAAAPSSIFAVFIAFGVALAPALSGVAEAADSPKLEGVRLIQIMSVSGDLTIDASGSGDAVSIAGDDEEQAAIVDREGDRLSIRTRHASLRIGVPASRKVEIHSISGEVRATGSFERLDVVTTSGDIDLNGEHDTVKVHTLSGDVRVRGTTKSLRVENTSGDVQIEGARGEVELRTTSGELMISESSANRLEAQTVSGDIRYSGKLVADAAFMVRTVSGDVRFEIDGPLDVHLEARTRNGEVVVVAPGIEHREESKRVERMFGKGGANIRAITLSGDIRLSGY